MINFIGIGAQKSGTSWVYACLYEHPEICAPIKEIHFFSRPRFEKGKEWYESHFNRCSNNAKKGEFSTSYLYSKEAPERIHDLYPNTKLIAILRNPKDRAYSQYRNAIKAGEIVESISFSEYTTEEPSAYEQGLYAAQLERYYSLFAKEQMLVMIYEDIKKNPAEFIRKVYDFLGIDSSFVPSALNEEINVARTPRSVGVDRVMHRVAESLRKIGFDKLVWLIRKSGLPDLIRSLNTKQSKADPTKPIIDISYFREDVSKLSELIGRDMRKEWDI